MGKNRIRNSQAISAQALMDRISRGDSGEYETQIAKLQDEKAELLAVIDRADFIRDENGVFIDQWTGIRLDKLGLHLDTELNEEGFNYFAERLVAFYNQMQLWIGDMVNLARARFQKIDVYQLAERYNLDAKTIDEYATICRVVPMDHRFENLSYSHYRMVRSRQYDEQRRTYLFEASQRGFTVDQFKEYLKGLDAKADEDRQEYLSRLGGTKFQSFERGIMDLYRQVQYSEKLAWIQRTEALAVAMRAELDKSNK